MVVRSGFLAGCNGGFLVAPSSLVGFVFGRNVCYQVRIHVLSDYQLTLVIKLLCPSLPLRRIYIPSVKAEAPTTVGRCSAGRHMRSASHYDCIANPGIQPPASRYHSCTTVDDCCCGPLPPPYLVPAVPHLACALWDGRHHHALTLA